MIRTAPGRPGGVAIGRDGWFHDPAAPFPPVGDPGERWARLLDDRKRALDESDTRYLHLVVPDRLSVLGERVLGEGEPERQSLVRTMPRRGKGAPEAWVDLCGYLIRQRDRHPLFWKGDSRWTPWAAFMALQLLCGRLGVEANARVLGYPHEEVPTIGDLASAWIADGGQASAELVRHYRFDRRSRPFYANELADHPAAHRLDRASAPGLIGARRGYRNAHPEAVARRVVIFGDRHAGLDRSLLSGMLAETFSEVHVVIAPCLDLALVHRLRADVVITQIDERDLETLPDDSVTVARRAARSLDALHADRARAVAGKPAVARVRPPVSTVLLASDTYRLDAPITAQPECVDDVNDAVMTSNPVTLHEVHDARVYFNGPRHLITDASGDVVSRFDVDEERRRRIPWHAHRRLPGTTLVFGTTAGAHCYYHWMLELLPKLGLLERAGIPVGSIDQVLVRDISGDWQRETLARCGVPDSKIIQTERAPHYACERALHIDLNCGINLKMHRFIPQWMKHLYPVDATGAERLRLFISRPPGVRRGIANEAELQPLLDAHGFTSIAMEGLTVAQQAELLARADVVMSPHGGALTNMVFCRPGTRIIELLSRHVYPYYYGLAASCGHLYHAVLEAPEEDYARLVNHDAAQAFAAPRFQHATHARSFDVPLDALERLLAKLPRYEPGVVPDSARQAGLLTYRAA